MNKLKKLMLVSLTFAFSLTLFVSLKPDKANASDTLNDGIPSELQKTTWVSENILTKQKKNPQIHKMVMTLGFFKNKKVHDYIVFDYVTEMKYKNGKTSKIHSGMSYGGYVKYKKTKNNSYYLAFTSTEDNKGHYITFTLRDNKIIMDLNPKKDLGDSDSGFEYKNVKHITFSPMHKK